MKCIKVNKTGRMGSTGLEIIRVSNEKGAEMVAEESGVYTSKSKYREFKESLKKTEN